MSSDWPEYPLSEVFSVTNGLSKPRSEFGHGYPFLTFKEVFSDYFLPEELANLANTSEHEREKCSIKAGDVFITRTSETFDELGKVCVALKDYPEATFNGFCKRLRPNGAVDIYPEYCAFFFCSPYFRKQINGLTNMSTRASLNNDMLKSLMIKIPDLCTQRSIGVALKRLNDKVELNRYTNQTLEQIAQTLFKSWFVDFDPVRAKVAVREHFEQRAAEQGTPLPAPAALDEARDIAAAATIAGLSFDPADIDGTRALLETKLAGMDAEPRVQLMKLAGAFPADLEGSTLGESPVGWLVKPLDSVARYQNGLALQKFRPEKEDEFLPVLKIAQLKKGYTDEVEKASPNIKESCKVHNGDVIFSWSGSLVVDVWCGGDAALNQHLFKITSKEYPKWFYYLFTKHHLREFQRIAAAKAVTMGHIKREHLREALCAVPSSDFIDLVSNTFASQLERGISLRLESRLLAEIRDQLLPKLLASEIQLKSEPFAEAS